MFEITHDEGVKKWQAQQNTTTSEMEQELEMF